MSAQKNFQMTVRERGITVAVGRFQVPDEPLFIEAAMRARDWFAREVASEAKARFLSLEDKSRAFRFPYARYMLTMTREGNFLYVEAILSWGEGAPLVRKYKLRFA